MMPERSHSQALNSEVRVLNAVSSKHVSTVTAHPCRRILSLADIRLSQRTRSMWSQLHGQVGAGQTVGNLLRHSHL